MKKHLSKFNKNKCYYAFVPSYMFVYIYIYTLEYLYLLNYVFQRLFSSLIDLNKIKITVYCNVFFRISKIISCMIIIKQYLRVIGYVLTYLENIFCLRVFRNLLKCFKVYVLWCLLKVFYSFPLTFIVSLVHLSCKKQNSEKKEWRKQQYLKRYDSIYTNI